MNFKVLLFLLPYAIASKNEKVGEILSIWSENGTCFDDIKKLTRSERINKMLETWSDFSEEYLYGNSFDFGDFEKCLSLNYGNIQPQHCLIQYEYKPTSNHSIISVLPKISLLNYHWKDMDKRLGGGICLPVSCTGENVKRIMSEIFKETIFVPTEDYNQNNYCVRKNPSFVLDNMRIISIVCLSIVTILVIIGTILTNSTSSTFLVKFFQCFSIKTNFQTLKDLSTTESTITCINGIKALSVFAIFIYHSFSVKFYYPFSDGKERQFILNEKEAAQKISMFPIAIDTFFIVSGVLVGRSFFNNKNFNFWKFLTQRYMRLTLLTLFLICFNAVNYSLLKLFPKPYMHLDHSIIDDCKDYWWTTALNIQTNINPKHMCIPPSWYGSVLFQLIVLAALIHLILRNLSKTTILISYGLLLICATFIHIYVFVAKDSYLGAEMGRVMDLSSDLLIDSYYRIYTRIIPFFSGVFLAYILSQSAQNSTSDNSNEKIKKFFTTFAYYFMIIFYSLGMLMFLLPLKGPIPKIPAIIMALLWIFANNIVIYICHMGHGGFINKFLSLKIWMPFSKMALTIYLLGPLYQLYNTMSRKEPQTTLTTFEIFFGFIYEIPIAAVPILLIYLTVECSITNLSTLLFKNRVKQTDETEDTKIKNLELNLPKMSISSYHSCKSQ